MIILDPTWSVDKLSDHRGDLHHALSLRVAEKLQHYVDEDAQPYNPIATTFCSVRYALLNVALVLGGRDLRDEVRAFLDTSAAPDPVHAELDSY